MAGNGEKKYRYDPSPHFLPPFVATAVRVCRPLAKRSSANQRKEHNVEKYFQWVTTQSLTIRVYLHIRLAVVVSQIC